MRHRPDRPFSVYRTSSTAHKATLADTTRLQQHIQHCVPGWPALMGWMCLADRTHLQLTARPITTLAAVLGIAMVARAVWMTLGL